MTVKEEIEKDTLGVDYENFDYRCDDEKRFNSEKVNYNKKKVKYSKFELLGIADVLTKLALAWQYEVPIFKSSDIVMSREEVSITFYTLTPSYGIKPNETLITYPYMKNFIDYVINIRLIEDREVISDAELNALLISFLNLYPEEIKKNESNVLNRKKNNNQPNNKIKNKNQE